MNLYFIVWLYINFSWATANTESPKTINRLKFYMYRWEWMLMWSVEHISLISVRLLSLFEVFGTVKLPNAIKQVFQSEASLFIWSVFEFAHQLTWMSGYFERIRSKWFSELGGQEAAHMTSNWYDWMYQTISCASQTSSQSFTRLHTDFSIRSCQVKVQMHTCTSVGWCLEKVMALCVKTALHL